MYSGSVTLSFRLCHLSRKIKENTGKIGKGCLVHSIYGICRRSMDGAW